MDLNSKHAPDYGRVWPTPRQAISKYKKQQFQTATHNSEATTTLENKAVICLGRDAGAETHPIQANGP